MSLPTSTSMVRISIRARALTIESFWKGYDVLAVGKVRQHFLWLDLCHLTPSQSATKLSATFCQIRKPLAMRRLKNDTVTITTMASSRLMQSLNQLGTL